MKILLNGATGGTNFGDFLFARIFHDAVSSVIGEENTYWYDSRYCLSDFYKRHLKCNSRKRKIGDIDALVCISGGYFCGGDKTLKLYAIRYLRYFHLCMRCIFRKIPVSIIGVDVAKPGFKPIDWIQKFILRHAEVVVVRNRESYEQLIRYGVKNPICTVDTAHIITRDMFENCEIQKDIEQLPGKKLFFHVQKNYEDMAKRLIPVIERFVETHPEYSVVMGMDQYWENCSLLDELKKEFKNTRVTINNFDDPMALCKVLDAMDLIVTPKLHVGIVGATLSKSVLSFSVHTEKVSRFYHQLREDGRSLPMDDFSEDKALEMLEKYHSTPISVDPEIIETAKKNIEILKEFIKKHS